MDPLNISSSNVSTRKRRADEKIDLKISKRARFCATYFRYQEWSLPDSIIYYISKNPSTSKCYQKFIQSCKYFFIKNPILVMSEPEFECIKNEWKLGESKFDFSKLSIKIWITEDLAILIDDVCETDANYLSTCIIPKIYQSDIEGLHVNKQNLFFNEFIFLASKCNDIWFNEVIIMERNGTVVSVEKIVESLPNIDNFVYYLGKNGSKIVSSKTASELIKIPYFSNLRFFELLDLPEAFDFDIFYEYLKKSSDTKIRLGFHKETQLSEAYKSRFQTIVNEILANKNREYKFPWISFPGIERSSVREIFRIWLQSRY